MKNFINSFFSIMLILAFTNDTVFGQEKNNQEENEKVEFSIAPYLLFGSLNGNATVGLTGPTTFDASFGDLLKNLRLAAMVHAELQNGKIGFITDFIYMKLGDKLDTPTGGVLDARAQTIILEAFPNYRIKKEWGYVDFFAGIRWWNINLDLELEGVVSGDANREQGWVDPVVGTRFFYRSPNNFIAGMRVDVGGFGAGSDFSFHFQTSVGYQISELFSIILQYKYLDTDFDNDKEGREVFAFDAAIHGPLLGFLFQFK